jgi:hypothetical protein
VRAADDEEELLGSLVPEEHVSRLQDGGLQLVQQDLHVVAVQVEIESNGLKTRTRMPDLSGGRLVSRIASSRPTACFSLFIT